MLMIKELLLTSVFILSNSLTWIINNYFNFITDVGKLNVNFPVAGTNSTNIQNSIPTN